MKSASTKKVMITHFKTKQEAVQAVQQQENWKQRFWSYSKDWYENSLTGEVSRLWTVWETIID